MGLARASTATTKFASRRTYFNSRRTHHTPPATENSLSASQDDNSYGWMRNYSQREKLQTLNRIPRAVLKLQIVQVYLGTAGTSYKICSLIPKNNLED